MSGTVKPRKVAITGGIASGKSAVGKYLSDKGMVVIDTDHLGHELLDSPNPAYDKVLERFGSDLVDAPGAPVNRQKLGQIVFSDGEAKRDLEAILHPAIEKLCEERIEANRDQDFVFVLVPLLFECGLESKYDEVWCVLVDRETQKQRLKARNGYSDDEALARINAQWPQERKAARSHRIIDNSGTLEETYAQVDKCLASASAQAVAPSAEPLPADPSRNEEYRDILRKFAEMAAGEALDRMGDVSTTRHKDARARLTMDVTAHGDKSPEGDSHHLEVNVQMCVKNSTGSGDSSGTGCSCKCGDTCRISCACAADCGCSCKKPEPPTPPAPPSKPGCEHTTRRCSGGLLAFLAFLAFLFAAGALTALVMFHPWDKTETPAKPPVCEQPDCRDPLKGRPILVLTDEQFDKLFCKPNCPKDPVDPPKPPVTCPGTACPPPVVTPPVEPPAPPKAGCYGHPTPSATPPDFILPYLHNHVRFKVTEWTVRCRQNELGATVVGRDDRGRAVVWMEFGPNCTFMRQWVVSYFTSGDVQVDLFENPNRFVGRTVYQYDNWGRLSLVKRLDGHQRPLTTGTFERNPDGTLCKVVVRRFDETGRLVDVVVNWYRPDMTLMVGEFFQYELFGQFK